MHEIAEKILSEFSPGGEFAEKEREDTVVLFVSLDLVNSTAFKSVHDTWPLVISRFYEISLTEIRDISTEFRLWKYVGDEVLFYRPVHDFHKLANDINRIFLAIGSVVEQMDAAFEEGKNFLSVKGTAWLAKVTYLPPGQMKAILDRQSSDRSLKNIMIDVPNEDIGQEVDFLGPDVDAGFRVAKFSDKKKLVLSANLAKCLISYCSGDSIDTSRLKIVGLEVLRGVWSGRHYPIIWYYDDWNSIGNSFFYDEVDEGSVGNDVVKRVARGEYKEISVLKKIYNDLNKNKEIEDIESIIRQGGGKISPAESMTMVNRSKMAEVHCAAICFNKEGKVLIAKRPPTKNRLKGVWEFGCGQLHLGQDFHECIKESYKSDFGAEISFISELPVSAYVIQDHLKVPGLLFYAEIENDHEIESIFVKSKHTEIKWHDPQAKITKSDFVPDFQKSLKRAIDYREARRAR